jgi:hypothetical protein
VAVTLCTMPGRAGDILWALPTIRAISEHQGAPVDLLVAGEFESLLPLLEQQPYLGAVLADHAWGMDNWIDGGGSLQQAWQPPTDVSGWEAVYHLGYRGWPELPLPRWTHSMLVQYGWRDVDGPVPPLDLDRPWITVEPATHPPDVACGWTECHFELKYGLQGLALYHFSHRLLPPAGSGPLRADGSPPQPDLPALRDQGARRDPRGGE